MRLARTGSTVGTPLIARETVVVDTLANLAISTRVILAVIVSDTVIVVRKNSTLILTLLAGQIATDGNASIARNGRTSCEAHKRIWPEPASANGRGGHRRAGRTAVSHRCLTPIRTVHVRCRRSMRASESQPRHWSAR